ncbi:MAG: hypothetical protein GY724_04610 [Actinomycetia bacterium]|nr:hypothetical protein [Actinomycetes bacterium]MCP4222566.1 hypothetical protein [Actinomycetes bacterium]MCP5033345.1 hypothetical protein [Actinomycetes bacterium]
MANSVLVVIGVQLILAGLVWRNRYPRSTAIIWDSHQRLPLDKCRASNRWLPRRQPVDRAWLDEHHEPQPEVHRCHAVDNEEGQFL